MEVKLLHNTPLNIADFAISKCWDKSCDMNNPNVEKINRVANKFKHASTIEHLSYNFEVKGVSRALLQELARHRMANYSVKSTRYTLKELESAKLIADNGKPNCEACGEFIVLPDPTLYKTSEQCISHYNFLCNELIEFKENKFGLPNDLWKYGLPESYKTELVWTINARSLQNFLGLRSDKSALWEIRYLANAVIEAIPNTHKFLFEHCMYKEKEKKG